MPHLERRIATLNSQLAHANTAAEASKVSEQAAIRNRDEALHKLKQAQELQQKQYQGVIKELFEVPAEDIKKNIMRESRMAILITLTISAISIVASILLSTYFQTKNDESTGSLQAELAALAPLVKSTNVALSTLNSGMETKLNQFDKNMHIASEDTRSLRSIASQNLKQLEQLDRISGTLLQRIDEKSQRSLSKIEKLAGDADMVTQLGKQVTSHRESFSNYKTLTDAKLAYVFRLGDAFPGALYEHFARAFNDSGLVDFKLGPTNFRDWDREYQMVLFAMEKAFAKLPDKKAPAPRGLCQYNSYKEETKQDFGNWGYQCTDTMTVSAIEQAVNAEHKRVANRLKANGW